MGVDPTSVDDEPDAATVTALLALDLDVPGLDRVLARSRVGERPWRARGDLVGDVGGAQHDARASCRARARSCSRLGAATTSSAGCKGPPAVSRPRRLDDEPRRRLALPRARPQPRTGRHDGAAAVGALRRRVGADGLDDDAALLLRVRGLPAHLPARGRRVVARSSSCCSTGCSRARCSTRSTTAEHRLGELDPTSARAGVDDEARRRVGRLRAELEFLRVGDALDDLPRCSRASSATAARSTSAIARRYFRETRVIEWSG